MHDLPGGETAKYAVSPLIFLPIPVDLSDKQA